jgi:hypothetical protein
MVASLCETSHREAFVFSGPIKARSNSIPREGPAMKKSLATLAALILITAPLAVQPTRGDDQQEQEKQQEKQKEKPASIWMKMKLAATQNILAGLTKGDFDAIEKNASSMLFVDHLEKWLRADTPGYSMRLKEFEYANKSLKLAAHEKNIDGATIAYVQLTLSCVECHKLIRDPAKEQLTKTK